MSKLKNMCRKKGIRQAELARRLNVSRSCVCMAEKAGIRNTHAAARYARVLGCDPLELIEIPVLDELKESSDSVLK